MSAIDHSSRLKSCGLALGFWTLLALSYAASASLSEISEGHPPTWTRMLLWNLTDFWLWMLLVPLIARLGRLTTDRPWGRFFLLHVPAGLMVALGQSVTRISAFWELCGPRDPAVHTLGQYMRGEIVYNFHLAVLTYWIILVVLRGMETARRLRSERLRSAELETKLAHSQLQALRSQIQPHFLFNTLNAISALALAEPLQARRMIARLSDMLRLTLEEHQRQQQPLARELEYVRHYLEIQQARFRDRLDTHIEITEEALRAEVPCMILQPLVENALHHGLLAKIARGNLRILACREGGHLRLAVEDDGLGLPPSGITEGVGLGNIRSRLEKLFGTAASLRLQPCEDGGTRVELRVPFRTPKRQGAS